MIIHLEWYGFSSYRNIFYLEQTNTLHYKCLGDMYNLFFHHRLVLIKVLRMANTFGMFLSFRQMMLYRVENIHFLE